jgi:hypothetical protein
MALPKRVTIYLDPKIHRALKLKAAETEFSVSDLVSEAVIALLNEDADDLATFDERRSEPATDFQEFLKQMKKDGDL